MSDTSTSGTTLGSQASSVASDLKDAASQTYEDVKDRARAAVPRLTETVRSQALDQAENAKDALASTGERLARSLRESFDTSDDSVQGKLMGAAADAVGDLAGRLRGRSLQDAMGDLETFARRNPGAFVAGAALAGFALARFARASARSTPERSYGAPYGASSSYGSPYAGRPGMGGAASASGLSTTGDRDASGAYAGSEVGGDLTATSAPGLPKTGASRSTTGIG